MNKLRLEGRFAHLKPARLLLFVIAVLAGWLYPASLVAAATLNYVQGNSAVPQTPQTTVNVTFTAAQAAGDLNVVVVGWNDTTATVSSVADKSGNTYTLAVGPTAFTGVLSQSIYYAKNIKSAAAAANIVTVTFSPAAAYPDIRILEYNGADLNSPVDVTAANTGNSSTTNSGSATTTNATDLLLGASMVATFTTGPGTGFTSRLLTSPDGDIAEDRMVTATGSYSATTAALSPAGPWVMQMVAFRTPTGTGDTTPPTAPSNLTTTVIGSQINLSWTASTDNVGVTGYRVERCQGAGCTTFAQIATPTATTYSDTGLVVGSYSYRVRATDAAGNLSPYSNVASGAITDTQPPTAPSNLTATVSGSQINLSWTASTDNVGVTGYLVERCQGAGCTTFAQIATPASTTYNDTGLTAATSYSYRVRATDAANNLSPYSTTATATTQTPQPPTTPSNLTATAASTSQINLSWTASTSNVGLANYVVQRCQGAGCSNFAQIATPTGTTYNDTGLASATSYNYRVQAVDSSGTASTFSNTAGATTLSAQNPIVLENQQPGTSNWQIGDFFGLPVATDAKGQIKGYASAPSVNKGGNINFYVSVNPAQTYAIDVYRIGWYQGLGGRLMQHIGPLSGIQQPACPVDATTGLIQCNWTPAYTLATQTFWTSGIYLAVLTNAQSYHNNIVFVVRDDSRVASLLYQQPVNTYQAYNSWGGRSLYSSPRAYKVSFDRPYQDDGTGDFLFLGENNFVRWMEKSGYDVTYSTTVDTHTNGSNLLNYRGLLAAGHNEYWSRPMYDAAVAARDAGVNLAFLGANPVYWQVRFEPSSSGVPNRVMVCYKDATLDPITDTSLQTVNWRDPLLNRPEQTLVGVQYTSSPQNSQVTYVVRNSGNWVYAGTSFKDGDTVPGIVGYEADRSFSDYPQPNAVSGTYTLLSHSPFRAQDNTPDYANSSIYQASSGAWVFGSGSIYWGWALDDYYPDGNQLSTVDVRIQRTMANILDRFVNN